MKKMYLVLAAVLLAVSFSAFTTIEKAPPGNYQYHNGTGLVDVPPGIDVDSFCPEGDQFNCVIMINDENEQIYKEDEPYLWE